MGRGPLTPLRHSQKDYLPGGTSRNKQAQDSGLDATTTRNTAERLTCP